MVVFLRQQIQHVQPIQPYYPTEFKRMYRTKDIRRLIARNVNGRLTPLSIFVGDVAHGLHGRTRN